MKTVYYGTGTGKTAAALGEALLAAGSGKQVAVVQFLKEGNGASFGQRDNLHWFSLGRNFDFFRLLPQQVQEDVTNTHHQLLKEAAAVVETGGLLVLDEVLNALNFGLVEEEVLLQVLNNLSPEVDIVFTGRTPLLSILDFADVVTQFRQEKQPQKPENPDGIYVEL